MRITGMK